MLYREIIAVCFEIHTFHIPPVLHKEKYTDVSAHAMKTHEG
jgi:hypothetical protein